MAHAIDPVHSHHRRRIPPSTRGWTLTNFPGVVQLLGENAKAESGGPFPLRRPVDMVFGSDGALYLLDYGTTWGANKDAKLIRISYHPGNRAPVAKASAKTTAGREPFTIELSSAGSSDIDGDKLSYEWRLLPEDKVLSKQANPKVTLSTPGDFAIELRVTDPKGASDSARLAVTVGNSPPEVRFESPQDRDFFTPGKPVVWKVTVKDAEDGASTDAAKAEEIAGRTVVSADWSRGDSKDALPPGQARMKASDCFACHAIEQQIVGPPLVSIAEKYRGQEGAAATTIQRVLKGSTGVWGQVPMLPHPQHTAEEVGQMVQWIFSLQKGAGGPAALRGLAGELAAPSDAATHGAVLEATYTDLGRAPAGTISTKAVVRLLARKVEAESAEAVDGGQIGDQGVRMNAGGLLKLDTLNLKDCTSITCRVASAAGGVIELRAGSKTGRLLAACEVKPTGGMDKWVEVTAPLKGGERGEVIVVCRFADKPVKGELMDLDWIRFDAP